MKIYDNIIKILGKKRYIKIFKTIEINKKLIFETKNHV